MRILIGFIAMMLWVFFLAWLKVDASADTLLLTCAIICAGAMAGGGGD